MKTQYPKIALHGLNGLTFVKKSEILYAVADGNYTHVFLTENRKVKVNRKLKEVNELLVDENFLRIHRSHLINLEHVISFTETDTVIMINKTALAVARNRKADFISKFTQL